VKDLVARMHAQTIRDNQWIIGTYAFCAGFALGLPLGFYVVWSVCSP